MRCPPTVRLLIVLTLPPSYRCPLSTDYRPLGSCSRAAGWSAATSCIGTNPTCRGGLTMSVDRGRPRAGRQSERREQPLADVGRLLARTESLTSSKSGQYHLRQPTLSGPDGFPRRAK